MLGGCSWSVSTWELFGTYVLVAGINEGHFKKRRQGNTNTKPCTWFKTFNLVKFGTTENSSQAHRCQTGVFPQERGPVLQKSTFPGRPVHDPNHPASSALTSQHPVMRSALRCSVNLTDPWELIGEFWHKAKNRTQGDIWAIWRLLASAYCHL